MRIAFIADIHANLPALEAVLEAIHKHRPERIISLGDQVNLGPCPRETLDLLRANNVLCLHGNHERYILCSMAGDPDYAGVNFESLRFNAALLTPQDITFPKTMQIGCVLCTHAMPEDDRFPVHNVALGLPRLKEMHFDKHTHILCGHGHNPTYYTLGNLSVYSIGSVGIMDDGIPGAAPYVIGEIDDQSVVLKPYYAQYNPSRLKPLFVRSGMADFCPIMARIACMEMTDNREYLVKFVARAQALSKEKREAHITPETWSQTDRDYPWADGLTAAQFWRKQ